MSFRGTGSTVIFKLPDAKALAVSAARAVKAKVPAAVGVPESAPDVARDSPVGREPPTMLQL